MHRLLILALVMAMGALPTMAQTSFYTDRALQQVNVITSPTPLTAAIPYGPVRVCSLPLTQQSPCLPLASITDVNGNAISNAIGSNFGQLTTDATGRFTFGCSVNNNYQVQVTQSASNTPAVNYPITCPGTGANPTFASVTINSGTGTFQILDTDRICDSFPGADLGLKCAAADANLGTSAGRIIVMAQTGNPVIMSGFTLTNAHNLVFLGGRLRFTSGIIAAMGSQIECYNGTNASSQVVGVTLEKNFTGDLITFNGSGTASQGTGGGVRNCLLENVGTDLDGRPIVITGSSLTQRAGFVFIENTNITAVSGSSCTTPIAGLCRWTSGITIDGSPFATASDGERDVWIRGGQIGGVGTDKQNVLIKNCFNCYMDQIEINNGNNGTQVIGETVTGSAGKPSQAVHLLDENNGTLLVDFANNVFVIQGQYVSIQDTANSGDNNFFAPAFLGTTFVENSATPANVIYNGRGVGTTGYISQSPFYVRRASYAFTDYLNLTDGTNTCNILLGNASGGMAFRNCGASTTNFGFYSSGSALRVSFPDTGGITPGAAAVGDIGSTALPWANFWLGTAATNNFKFAPAATAASRVISMPDPLSNVQLGESLNTGTSVYQSKRGVTGCTTAASIGGICATDITVTWTTAFADANYSVTCTGSTPTAVPAAPFVVSGTKLAATVHINYFAITAVAASYATIDCTAVHD